MLRVGLLILGISIFVVGFESSELQAAESLSCKDFSQLIGFVRKEHLRFRSQTKTSTRALIKSAIENLPETFRDQGYFMLAANQDSAKLRKLVRQEYFSSNELCQQLGDSLTRLMFLKALVRELDPFSDFYLAEEMETRSSVVSGEFVGVGIGTDSKFDYLYVDEVVQGGPSDGKLRTGDHITHIDGYPVRGLQTKDLRKRIRGEEATNVVFKVDRPNIDKPLTVTVTRGRVFQKTVSHEIKPGGIVQMRIHRFYAHTAQKIRKILNSIKGGAKGMILDLRDNPGGLLQGARDVVDLFVKQGVVVHLRGLYKDQLWALDSAAFADFPMVVLINSKTASASEIVAGALQDYGRAVLVGRQTFGKSCVQNIYETKDLGLEYPGGLKLTTLWYYLPSGRSVRALRPDFEIPVTAEEAKSEERNEMPYEMAAKIPVQRLYTTDSRPGKNSLQVPNERLTSSEEFGAALLKELLAIRSN